MSQRTTFLLTGLFPSLRPKTLHQIHTNSCSCFPIKSCPSMFYHLENKLTSIFCLVRVRALSENMYPRTYSKKTNRQNKANYHDYSYTPTLVGDTAIQLFRSCPVFPLNALKIKRINTLGLFVLFSFFILYCFVRSREIAERSIFSFQSITSRTALSLGIC